MILYENLCRYFTFTLILIMNFWRIFPNFTFSRTFKWKFMENTCFSRFSMIFFYEKSLSFYKFLYKKKFFNNRLHSNLLITAHWSNNRCWHSNSFCWPDICGVSGAGFQQLLHWSLNPTSDWINPCHCRIPRLLRGIQRVTMSVGDGKFSVVGHLINMVLPK